MTQHDPQHFSDTSTKTSPAKPQRNSKGHFVKGNTVAVGASGNPDPCNKFEPGNQAARKSGLFAKLFPEVTSEMFEWASVATLDDELNLCRVMLQTNLELTEQLKADIKQVEEPELKRRMLDALFKMEGNTVAWITRIESITKTISKVGLTMVMRDRERAEEQLAQLQH